MIMDVVTPTDVLVEKISLIDFNALSAEKPISPRHIIRVWNRLQRVTSQYQFNKLNGYGENPRTHAASLNAKVESIDGLTELFEESGQMSVRALKRCLGAGLSSGTHRIMGLAEGTNDFLQSFVDSCLTQIPEPTPLVTQA